MVNVYENKRIFRFFITFIEYGSKNDHKGAIRRKS